MREIKFRGKSVNGDWHTGLLAVSQGKATGRPEKGYYISNDAGMPWAYQVRPETVGQYTDLNDKNGKEIYEGDIISIDAEYNVEVYWDDGAYFVTDPKNELGNMINLGYIVGTYMAEVIGNIIDNPELIGG